MRESSKGNNGPVESNAPSEAGAGGQSPPRPHTHVGRRGTGHKLWFWLGITVLVHAEVLLLLGVLAYVFLPRDADLARAFAGRGANPDTIEVGMLDEEAAREIIADLEKQEEERKAEEERKELESVHPPGQVVDLPTPREEKRPDKAEFVSEHDSTVERQTKRYGRFEDKSRLGDATGTASKTRPPAPSGDGRMAMRTPDLGRFLRGGAPGPSGRTGRPGSAYGMPSDGNLEPGGLPELGAEVQPRPGGGGTRGGTGPMLMPSEEQLARAIGGGTQDALRDIDDGDETALNSKRWRFASFFNRVKRQVAEHWHPDEVYRQRDPTGAVYGRRNRYTELRIQLKPDGRLSKVALASPSGLEFLDDEAIEAFKEAEPFPNPPRQLVENGFINFGFGFLFDLNGPPQMRWFRYNY
jgi:TonB family protein